MGNLRICFEDRRLVMKLSGRDLQEDSLFMALQVLPMILQQEGTESPQVAARQPLPEQTQTMIMVLPDSLLMRNLKAEEVGEDFLEEGGRHNQQRNLLPKSLQDSRRNKRDRDKNRPDYNK